MAKDVRALREEAAEATASGKYKRALAAYLELERLEPRDAQWAKRAGETYKRLGNNKHAIEAFERSADRYAQNGFLVQAIAVCKLVLQIDPNHAEALNRISSMNEQLGAGPTRAGGMAEANPGLHETDRVAVLRQPPRQTVNPNPRSKFPTNQRDREPSQRIPMIRDSPSSRVSSTQSPAIGQGTGRNEAIPQQPRTVTPVAQARVITPATVKTGPVPTVTPSKTGTGPVPAITPPRTNPGALTPSKTGTGPVPAITKPAQTIQKTGRQPIVTPAMPTPTPRSAPAQGPVVPRTTSPSAIMSRTKTSSGQPVSVSRTKSKPISLPPGAGIDHINLSDSVPESYQRDQSAPGIHVIPIDDEAIEMSEELDTYDYDRVSAPVIEVEPPDQEYEAEITEPTELELDDIEEIPLPEPLFMGAAAHKALQATPLFAGLPGDALTALVENLQLVHLDVNDTLFKEGEAGDALYVIVEGEVSVQAEGPPRVEMARLGAGSFIGEVALMTDQPRSATVVAISNAELLRIDRHTLGRVLADHGDVLRAVLRFVRDRLVDRWMRTSPLFRPFDEAQRAELAAKFNFLEIEDGTTLISTGTRPDGLYIVLAGHFIVQRDATVLATLGAGELIGETALLSNNSFKASVKARGKSLALHLPANEFREIIMTHPHVLEYIGEQAEHSRRLQIL